MSEEKTEEVESRPEKPERSILTGCGCLTMALSLVAVQLLVQALQTWQSALLHLLTDAARLGLWIGITLLLLGLVRNARYRREFKRQNHN